ncbi:MAG: hypothetical protein IIA72_15420 [Proteobacteria bacterium]|nr:hypothetical protein [Pseudomonadota bacterium]
MALGRANPQLEGVPIVNEDQEGKRDEGDGEQHGFKVSRYDLKVMKLPSVDPKEYVTWVFHGDGIHIAVEFEFLMRHFKKLQKQALESLRTCKRIERKGGAAWWTRTAYNWNLVCNSGLMIGALAMGYARQSTAQAAVALPLGILTIGWAGGGSGWFFNDQMEFLFADGGLRPVLPLVGLALVALSTLLALRDDLSFARAPCFRWGTFLVAATLIITTTHSRLASAFYNADFSTKQVLLIVASIVLVAAAAVAGRVESTMSRPAMLALLVMLLAMMIPAGDITWVGMEFNGVHLLFGLYVLAVFAMALFTIWLGMQARNTRLVNIGMVSTTRITRSLIRHAWTHGSGPARFFSSPTGLPTTVSPNSAR